MYVKKLMLEAKNSGVMIFFKKNIKCKVLQDAKRRRDISLADLKLYFASCLVWVKNWVTLTNRKLLELGRHDLRFGWHTYLWYEKVKVNKEFKNHFIGHERMEHIDI